MPKFDNKYSTLVSIISISVGALVLYSIGDFFFRDLVKNTLEQKFEKYIFLFKKKKICGILQETVINAGKQFLIVGIGINTNLDPKNRSFSSTSLKHITNKNIDNEKLFIMIKKNNILLTNFI